MLDRWRTWLPTVVTVLATVLLAPGLLQLYGDHLDRQRKRHELKVDAYRTFSRESIDVLNRLTELYHFDGSMNDFDQLRRHTAARVNALIWMGNELYLAYEDESLFADGQRLKQTLQNLNAVTRQRSTKASLSAVEKLQDEALAEMKFMQLKMVREMGRLSEVEYQEAAQRVQQRLPVSPQPPRSRWRPWLSIGKTITGLGLMVSLVGAVVVGTMGWSIRTAFVGPARLFGPDAPSRMEGVGLPADPVRWARGWLLVYVGFVLQIIGLWLA